MFKALLATACAMVIVIAFIYTARAQTPPSPTAAEQVLGQKLLAEINAGLQCSANFLTVQATLAQAQVEIKRLKDKYEPEPAK